MWEFTLNSGPIGDADNNARTSNCSGSTNRFEDLAAILRWHDFAVVHDKRRRRDSSHERVNVGDIVIDDLQNNGWTPMPQRSSADSDATSKMLPMSPWRMTVDDLQQTESPKSQKTNSQPNSRFKSSLSTNWRPWDTEYARRVPTQSDCWPRNRIRSFQVVFSRRPYENSTCLH